MAVESQFYSENLAFQDCNFHPFHNDINIPHLQNHGVSSSSTSVSFSPMAAAYSLNSELELQRREIDFILQLQNQKLRIALHEQRKNQLTTLLGSLETEALNLMKQKEEEIAQATRKAMELEERLKQAEMENEAWKRAATAKEAVVRSLYERLEEAKERQFLAGAADEAESCCNEEEEVGFNGGLLCRNCKNRKRCVLFLPCRHMCCCKYCEAFLGFCPVCKCAKEASMEVFLV